MNSIISILIMVGVLSFIAALIVGTWFYIRKHRPGRRPGKIGAIVLCTILVGATLGITIYAWPKAAPEHTLSDSERATLQQMYTNVTSSRPIFSDSLQEQDGNQWDVGTWHQGDYCNFEDQAYHIKSIEQNYYSWCIAEVPLFRNFAFQVQMTILTGNGGGLVFRASGKSGNYYYFGIGRNGQWSINRFIVKADEQELQSGSSTSIKTALNQVNLVSVIAKDSHLYLFVNKQPIAEVNDSAYDAGQIGLAADEDDDTTEVAFADAQVWTL